MSAMNPLWTGALIPAAMPGVELTSLAANQLELTSLFLVGLLASAFVVQGVWNGLLAEFPKMSRMSFWRAIVIVSLWGLLFVIVLAVVSGAQEFLQPGVVVK